MRVKILGLGAAGNKAAIKTLEKEIIGESDVVLLNTTLKDIPSEFKQLAVKFSKDTEGCGKERVVGKKTMLQAIQNKDIDLSSFIDMETNMVILAASTEGGSGSGAINICAKYYIAMNIPVHVFAFIGFNDDVRGIKNTLEFFKDLDDNIILHVIKNSEFLDWSGNHSKAEELANEEFANQVEALIGSYMIPSEQNIDDKDMYKICNNTGYMDIQKINLQGVKNQVVFNQYIQEAYDNIKGFDFDQSAKRLGVIINASEKTINSIDHNFEVIKRYIGQPFEVFRHIQYDNEDEYMYVFAAGMNFPSDGIKEIGKLYKELNEKVNRSTNSFKDIFNDIDLEEGDDDFDMDIKQIHNPDKVDELFSSMVLSQDNSNKKSSTKVKPTNIKNVVEVSKKKETSNEEDGDMEQF